MAGAAMNDFWDVRAASAIGLVLNAINRRDIDDKVMEIINLLTVEFGGGALRYGKRRKSVWLDIVGIHVVFAWVNDGDPNPIYAQIWLSEHADYAWSNPPEITTAKEFADQLRKVIYSALNDRCERDEQADGADQYRES